jgi:V/A-type H+/Na+-transporting ATPase subunit K
MDRCSEAWCKQLIKICFIGLALMFVGMVGFSTVKAFAVDTEPAAEGQAVVQVDSSVKCWGFLAAAISTGFGIIGAGIAVSQVGAAAMGTIGERPELAGRALIFVGLAEGLAILGLLTSILILNKI